MSITFKRASKKQAKLRLALCGSSGSGKTFTALALATELAGKNGKILVMDTERGSASKYAGIFEFDVADEFQSFGPMVYVQTIRAAQEAGYDVMVIDSLSHAWAGKGGALEQADNAAAKSGNKFTAWAGVTPQHNELIDAMIGCKMHLIVTMRTKQDYVLEDNGKGKMVPRKVGMAPIQRDGMEYEFDVTADMDQTHTLTVSKTRCAELDGAVIRQPGADLAKKLKAWLSDGVPATETTTQKPRLGDDFANDLLERLAAVNRTVPQLKSAIEATGVVLAEHPGDWDAELAPRITSWIERAAARNAEHTKQQAAGNGMQVNGHANGTANGHSPAPTAPTPAPTLATPAPAPAPKPAPAPAKAPAAGATTGRPQRKRWPKPTRTTPAHPAYWRDRLVMAVADHLTRVSDDSLKAVPAEALADGIEQQFDIPEPFDADTQLAPAELEKYTVNCVVLYRQLLAKVQANDPSIDWDAASIPF